MSKLTNKVALITGADSGMGQAIAEEFAREGADIVIGYHSDRGGAEETRRLTEQHGRNAIVHQLDVRDEAAVANCFEVAAGGLGVPHILVNNAGVGGGSAKVAEMTTED